MGRARAHPHPMCGARGRPSDGPGGRPSEVPLREGLAHGAGPGPGTAHRGINIYSAQEGSNSYSAQERTIARAI